MMDVGHTAWINKCWLPGEKILEDSEHVPEGTFVKIIFIFIMIILRAARIF